LLEWIPAISASWNYVVNCTQRVALLHLVAYIASPTFYVSTLQRLCSQRCAAHCHEHSKQRKCSFQKSHVDAKLAL